MIKLKPSLAWKIGAAQLGIVGTAAGLIALLVWVVTSRQWQQYLVAQEQAGVAARVAEYYEATGTLATLARDWNSGAAAPPAGTPLFGVVDANGVVVLPLPPRLEVGRPVPPDLANSGEPVVVDGRTIAHVIVNEASLQPSSLDTAFLRSINISVLIAVAAASAIALLLGLLLTRTITRPLRQLTGAVEGMTRGDLAQSVPVRGEDEIGALAAAFNQMSADLSAAVAQRRQLTADIAHDLRTPLTVISGYLESMQEGVLAPTPQRLATLASEVDVLQRLVADLSTLAQADAGGLTLQREALDPAALLRDAAGSFGHAAAAAGVNLKVAAAADLPAISADPTRLAQVLGNLISNSLRHTPAGGTITLTADASGPDQIALLVTDTGSGIPAADLPHIFDRFYRADKARSEGSAGLGLAICKAIITAHGGSIFAGSVPGQGASFTLTLPLAEP